MKDSRSADRERELHWEVALEQHMPELPPIDRIKIAAQFFMPIVKEMEVARGVERAHAIMERASHCDFQYRFLESA